MATSEVSLQAVSHDDSTKTLTAVETMETKKTSLELTNSEQNDTVAPGDDPTVTSEEVTTVAPGNDPAVTSEVVTTVAPGNDPAVTSEVVATVAPGNDSTVTSEQIAPGDDPAVTSEQITTVAPGDDPAVNPEKEAGLVSVTGCGEEVCVTVCEGDKEKKRDTLPNGKPSSATFPRQNRHKFSFSSTHSGRLSPYGSDGQSSCSDVASLSQEISFSVSQHTMELTLVVEQLKQDLLTQLGTAVTRRQEREGERVGEGEGEGEGEDLTKTLLELVVTLKMELANLKEENDRLRNVRSNMDNEIHELTENLFEEAYKMVDEAKGGKVSAEKRLADAAGKMDAMETEVSTLKRIIQSSQQSHASSKSSTSSLHPPPNSLSPSQKHRRSSLRRAVRKIQKRAGLGAPRSPSVSAGKVTPIQPMAVLEHRGGPKGGSLVTGEIDQEEYAQFHHWIKSLSVSSPPSPSSPSTPTSSQPSQNSLHPYLTHIVQQDIRPCLSFKNAELSERVLSEVQENSVTMEALKTATNSNGHPGHVRSASLPPEGVLCALCEAKERDCTHRMRLGEGREWVYISQSCRDRVAAVCDFFMHIGHIQKGIIKADTTKLYWQVAKLRGLIQLSRYSLSLPPDIPTTH